MDRKALLAVLSSVLFASSADAARTFQFNYFGIGGAGQVNGSVNFTTDDIFTEVDGRNALKVTDIGGVVNGVSITGLSSSFPEQYGGPDNYIFFQIYTPLFSFNGISFSYADGRYGNYFNDGFIYYELTAESPFFEDEEALYTRFLTYDLFETTAAVPEPSSWALMLGGFGAVGGAIRLRRKNGNVIPARASA